MALPSPGKEASQSCDVGQGAPVIPKVDIINLLFYTLGSKGPKIH